MEENKKRQALIVNLFGPPGAGKSTGAAYIFALLKMAGVNAELVTEFAKDKVWENCEEALKNQAYVFGEQYYRITRCVDKVDVIVTDSPILLSVLYNSNKGAFDEFVKELFDSNTNINYLLRRVKPYNHCGRLQSALESDELDRELREILNKMGIQYTEKDGDEKCYREIANEIISLLTSS